MNIKNVVQLYAELTDETQRQVAQIFVAYCIGRFNNSADAVMGQAEFAEAIVTCCELSNIKFPFPVAPVCPSDRLAKAIEADREPCCKICSGQHATGECL